MQNSPPDKGGDEVAPATLTGVVSFYVMPGYPQK